MLVMAVLLMILSAVTISELNEFRRRRTGGPVQQRVGRDRSESLDSSPVSPRRLATQNDASGPVDFLRIMRGPGPWGPGTDGMTGAVSRRRSSVDVELQAGLQSTAGTELDADLKEAIRQGKLFYFGLPLRG